MKVLFFDLETTGVDTQKDRIVQISGILVDGTNKEEFDIYINPQMKIPKEASDVHGITDERVADEPILESVAENIYELFNDKQTILAGYNILNFDIPLLISELSRCGYKLSVQGREVLEVSNLVKRLIPRTLGHVFKSFYGMSIKDVYGGAHNAINDVKATEDIFFTLAARLAVGGIDEETVPEQPDLSMMDIDASAVDYAIALSKYSRYDAELVDSGSKFKLVDGRICFNFGKFNGVVIDSKNYDHRGFLAWMLKGDFASDTKDIVRELLE
jgi:DNA polymerase-3 subunit epsilon